MAENEEKIIDPEIAAEWEDNSTQSLIDAINEAEAEEADKKKKTKKKPLTEEQKKAIAEQRTEMITDTFTIPHLHSNIITQIRNLCRNDYIEPSHVDDLPHYHFHINFKKSLLEECVRQAIKDDELKSEDLVEIYEFMGIEKKGTDKKPPIYTVDDFKLELFKLKKVTSITTFDLEKFRTYTEMLEDLLSKSIKYKALINVLKLVSLKERVTKGRQLDKRLTLDTENNGYLVYSVDTIIKDSRSVNFESYITECEELEIDAGSKEDFNTLKKVFALTQAILAEIDYELYDEMLWSETEKDEDDEEFFIDEPIYTLNYKIESAYYQYNRLIEDEDKERFTEKIEDFNKYKHETASEKKFKSNFRPRDTKNNITPAEEELLNIYYQYYDVLYCNIFNLSNSLISNVLTYTFEMLLKLQFNANLDNAVMREGERSNIVFSQEFFARFLGKNVGNYGKILSMMETRLPDISMLYQLAEFLNSSPSELLGAYDTRDGGYANERNFYEVFGLRKDTLDHLANMQEAIKSGYGDGFVEWFNNGLNNLISNCYYSGGYINSYNDCFIKITKEDLAELHNLYYEGLKIALDSGISEVLTKTARIKEKNGVVVTYIKKAGKPLIRKLVKGSSSIDQLSQVRHIYIVNGIKLTVEPNGSVKIERLGSDTVNYTWLDKGKEIWELDINKNRVLVVGNEDKDVLTSLLGYLGGRNVSMRFIRERDLENLYNATQISDDEEREKAIAEAKENGTDYVDEDKIPRYLEIDSFYEEVSTNYGETKQESDNFQLLEIFTRLKNLKDSLK